MYRWCTKPCKSLGNVTNENRKILLKWIGGNWQLKLVFKLRHYFLIENCQSMEQSPWWNVDSRRIIEKFLIFDGMNWFNVVSTRARHWTQERAQAISYQQRKMNPLKMTETSVCLFHCAKNEYKFQKGTFDNFIVKVRIHTCLIAFYAKRTRVMRTEAAIAQSCYINHVMKITGLLRSTFPASRRFFVLSCHVS